MPEPCCDTVPEVEDLAKAILAHVIKPVDYALGSGFTTTYPTESAPRWQHGFGGAEIVRWNRSCGDVQCRPASTIAGCREDP